MKDLTRGKLGYAIEHERRFMLQSRGLPVENVMRLYKDSFPAFNPNADPLGVMKILDQGSQGACQGHSLAMIFSICYFLASQRFAAFSRACGYYISQRYDGIRGDQGSTLSAGQRVATDHGMCLESVWKYPSAYNSNEPAGLTYPFKLNVTKPFTDSSSMLDWLNLGLPIQTGINWNDSCDVEVLDNYSTQRGGGHSTTLWQKHANGNVLNLNSWGTRWCGDGIQQWTQQSIDRMLRDQFTVFIGYAPDGMSFPKPEIVDV